jgi:teichuronic acid exporter
MSIRQNFFSGVFWTGIGKYSNYFIQILLTVILARLLTPSDFGLIAMVLVYNGFIDTITEGGISSAVVQKKELTNNQLSSSFWFSLFIGVGFVVLTFFISEYLEAFFEMNDLAIVANVLCFNFLIVSVTSVPLGILRRDYEFKKIAVFDISATFIAAITAVWMALNGFGYWSLVWNILIRNGFNFIPIFFSSKFRPAFTYKFSDVKLILGYSAYLSGFRSINYWARNADNFIIGKFLGSSSLGFYDQAYKLLRIPIQLINGIINPILHPILSSMKNDPVKMKEGYLKVIETIAIISFPIGVVFILNADVIITLLWGSQWVDSIPIFRILAFLTLIQPITSTAGSVFMSTDKVNQLFWIGLFNSIIMILSFIIGLPFGASGIALSYTIAFFGLVTPITLYYVFKIFKINFHDIINTFKSPLIILISILVIQLMVLFINRIININDYILFLVGIIVTMSVFITVFYYLYKDKEQGELVFSKIKFFLNG